MKFKVYKEQDKKEKIVRFKIDEHLGGIRLIAVDEDGERLEKGSILAINPEGKLELYLGIVTDLGLELDELGAIKIVDK